MVASPEYACQLVLVAKLTAVLSASGQGTLARPAGLRGREP
jgi:hypothetical protein